MRAGGRSAQAGASGPSGSEAAVQPHESGLPAARGVPFLSLVIGWSVLTLLVTMP